MKIKIKFFSPVREIVKRKEEEVEIGEDSTLKDLLNKLAEKYGKTLPQIPCIILVNSIGANQLGGEKVKLKEGDLVTFIPMLSGG